ncbi:MAG TPA: hypothetical protein VII11_07140 [Bacteroidota bacterium]
MPQNAPTINAGLCERCKHARVVESTRGSAFSLCELSATNPRFPKYPRLPVLSCSGFEEKENPSEERIISSP